MPLLAFLAALGLPPAPPPPPPIPAILSVTDAGTREIVHVVFLNQMNYEMPAIDPLNAKLIIEGRVADVTLRRIGDARKLPANGYLQIDYWLDLPSPYRGRAILSFGDQNEGYSFKIVGPLS